MASNALIAFLVGLGSGTWIYTKVMRRSGNNSQQAVFVAAFVGIIIFIVVITLLGLIFH